MKLLKKRIPDIRHLPNNIVGIIDANTFRISSLSRNEEMVEYENILQRKAVEGFDCILELGEKGLTQRTFFNV